MNKKKKIINILLAVVMLTTFNFFFILNSCSNSSSNEIIIDQGKSNALYEDDNSAVSDEGSAVSEHNDGETDVPGNENDSQANENGNEKEKANSEESSDTSSEENPKSLKNIYQRFTESGRPSIIVFSYDADCCPGTKAFFEEYNDNVMKLMKSYVGEFDTLFINMGILDKKNMNTAVEIAAQNEVLNIPSILILDKKGKAYRVVEGFFDEVEVKKVLDRLLDD